MIDTTACTRKSNFYFSLDSFAGKKKRSVAQSRFRVRLVNTSGILYALNKKKKKKNS